MTRARDLADSADKDIAGTLTLDGLTVAGNVSADGGTIKLDGNYPVGTQNVALGDSALSGLTTGQYNVGVGHASLAGNSTGWRNVAVGRSALQANDGNDNTGVGYASLASNTTGQFGVAVGKDALITNTTGSNNTGVGYQSLHFNTTASNNTAVGYQAGYSNTTGDANVYLGRKAGYTGTTARLNTFVGDEAGGLITSGQQNVYMGNDSGYSTTTGSYNVALGASALVSNTTASYNVAVGFQAGYNTTTAGENAFFGSQSGYAVTTGVQNSFIGEDAGSAVTTGSKNAILGSYNGNQGGLDIRTSSNNIVLSDGDGNPRIYVDSSGALGVNTNDPDNYPSSTQTGSTQALFRLDGNVAALAISNTGNELAFTRNSLNYISCPKPSAEFRIRCGTGGGVNLANGGTSWSSVSDERLKTITADIEDASNKVKTLRTVLGTYNDDVHNTPHAFLIAQDVQAVLPEAVSIRAEDDTLPHDGITDKLELSYTEVIPLLTAALKEVISKNEELEARITALENA